jgi:hypothetical protein
MSEFKYEIKERLVVLSNKNGYMVLRQEKGLIK